MTETEEEVFIVSQVMAARHKVELLKKEAANLRFRISEADRIKEEMEQAMIDYMVANGIAKTETDDFNISLGKSMSVDVTDIESVPERYIRVKEVKEVNKALIKAENLPASNWLVYSEKPTLNIKSKHA